MPFGCLTLWDRHRHNSLSDVMDKYEIGQTLRVKEFCELCLAKDRQTNKVFFCKKFLKKDGRKVRKAAKNEITILEMVHHPNILQLIDTFETRKEYFIIQELATGGDVFEWILDQGNYTERDASNVIRQVLEAVAYLHSLNIVHRNLKLENLMYYTENNHNKVVLRDFYLSRFENGAITEPCGTPEYLAPEVVARHRYGCPVDCWALGVIMFMLLSGNPPFYDETEEENTDLHNRIIFCRIVAGEFEFDSPYWDDISTAAKDLVCRLMEVDPELRMTAQDALEHDWIAGRGALEKNLKDAVCAQFEKNFAKAKWRKAIRVTTFMQRLRAPESGPRGEKRDTREQGSGGGGNGESHGGGANGDATQGNPSEGISTAKTKSEPLPDVEIEEVTKGVAEEIFHEAENKPDAISTPSNKRSAKDEHSSSCRETNPDELPQSYKIEAVSDTGPTTLSTASKTHKPQQSHEREMGRKPPMTSDNWCQTQLPDDVAEKGAWLGAGGDAKKSCGMDDCCVAFGKGMTTPRKEEVLHYANLLSESNGAASVKFPERGSLSSDWQMDSVIEQIEKQMAAVFEKLGEDIPLLKDQISERGELKQRSTHASPSATAYQFSSPSQLPVSSSPHLLATPYTANPHSHSD